jgi:hypothetical protein
LKPKARKYHVGGKQREITHLPIFNMSTLQVRALQRAQKDFALAKKQLQVARLRTTTYRGIDYEIATPTKSVSHKAFTYRGVPYSH